MNKREFTPEEIAKSLRVCINIDGLCRGCVYSGDCGGDILCADQLREAAAGLIEAQAGRIEELEGQLILRQNELLREREKHRWIPVEERLPEPEKRVLIMTNYRGWNGKPYCDIMCGFYEDGNVWCEDSKANWDYEMKREENYDESREDYRVPEGWFEELLNHIEDYNCVLIGEPVTHWMPMPKGAEG